MSIAPEKWRTVAGVLGAALIGLVVYLAISQILSNKQAIEKGCILLNNAIVRSQAEADRKGTPSSVLVAIILDEASEQRKVELAAAIARQRKQGNPIVVPCKKLSDHPEQIRAEATATIPMSSADKEVTTTPKKQPVQP